MPPKRKAASKKSTATDWSKQTVAQLRKACKDAGLESTGTKAVLVKRLEDNDEGSAPPTKMRKEESFGTKVKKAFAELKTTGVNKTRKAKIDTHCPLNTFMNEVYKDYDCMLNQTNICKNNNKYYVIQLIHSTGIFKTFHTWNRWGRVGEPGKHKMTSFGNDEEAAIKDYEKKFRDKTKNEWKNRSKFSPVPGKYTLLEMDDEDEEEISTNVINSKKPSGPVKPSSLDKETQQLIKLLFDEDMFKEAMQNLHIDIKKMPLGKLSKPQIAKGFEALIELEDAIKKKKNNTILGQLTSKFYTLIPHNFGRTVPPIINTAEGVQAKKDMLIVLSDIELANTLQKQGDKKKVELDRNPLDVKYDLLKCKLQKIKKESAEYKKICNYTKATGPGHLILEDIWTVDREKEGDRFKAHNTLGNRKLLWHGTSVAVVAAILKSGLRIMPHSGGRVGRGIYFASENSKSAGYVGTTGGWNSKNATGIMFLAEVALGRENQISRDNSGLTKAPSGYDSVVAMGRQEPDSKQDTFVTIEGKNIVIPQGKPVTRSKFNNSSFWQSEYLVYKESQARIRYLLKFKFYQHGKGW